MASRVILVPDPTRQVRFHDLLVVARKTWLMDALQEALGVADPNVVKAQLSSYIPPEVQQILARSGIRDEHVFPVPALLEVQPTLVGYYRLLLGIPQKTFYRPGSGMSTFHTMESNGTINDRQRERLPDFCAAMGEALAELIRQVSPVVTPRDVAELPLLTLGSQFQGGNNNAIGQVAIKGVFLAIAKIVGEWATYQTDSELRVISPEGRAFLIALANDPDVRVQEIAGSELVNRLSIEVKGGTDTSNVYNRGGEAEKSHQGAKEAGYAECWTIIGLKNIDKPKLVRGSPTTDVWFDTAEILSGQGDGIQDFRDRLLTIIASNKEKT